MENELLRALSRSDRLPSPPGVALRILELARSDDACLEDMSKIISSDPALAGRILKFINSPMAGMGRKVTVIDDAVNRIGLRGVQLMALSFSLISSEKADVSPSFDFDSFWSRSLACAVAGKVLAESNRVCDPNEAFIVGLLFHIGQLALACAVPDGYESVLQGAADLPANLLEIEAGILGIDHLEVSDWLLRNWGLPESICQVVGHSRKYLVDGKEEHLQIEDILLLVADFTATLLCHGKEERTTKVEEVLNFVRDHFDLDEESWSELFDKIIEDWQAYGKLLSVQAGTDKSFSDLQDEARQHIAAISLATQMENLGIKEENQQLLRRSRIDGLTGIANRTSFDERLEAELERASRLNRPLALLLVDIDHFKGFNDTYGHQVGDAVLCAVAHTLEDCVRKVDVAARYGGEEFGVIAPECNLAQAATLGERLRATIEELRVNHAGKGLRVTISVGIAYAEWPDKPSDAQQLIQSADNSLYQAKESGRNCCRCEPMTVQCGLSHPAAA